VRKIEYCEPASVLQGSFIVCKCGVFFVLEIAEEYIFAVQDNVSPPGTIAFDPMHAFVSG
jgi:hypothetical protein